MGLSIYQWLCLLGVPSMIAGLFAMFKYLIKAINALKAGTQAMLRAQMLSIFNEYKHKPVPSYVRDNFQNLWVQYETLGANGVLSDVHNRFLAFPIADDDD